MMNTVLMDWAVTGWDGWELLDPQPVSSPKSSRAEKVQEALQAAAVARVSCAGRSELMHEITPEGNN
jgi:hypothetical protein